MRTKKNIKNIQSITPNSAKPREKPVSAPKTISDIQSMTQMQNTQGAKSIAVCVPAYGTVTAAWLIHFMRFVMNNVKKYVLHLFIHEQQPVSVSRTTLIDLALEKNPDYIFFLDSDNVLPEPGLTRMIDEIERQQADMVTAMYFAKDAPHYPVIREYKSGGFFKIDNPALGQQFQIAGCGLGCCIIKPNVFHKLEKPWFVFNNEKWGKKDITLSEDLYFCRKMMRANMRIICDSSIISSHIGSNVDVMEYMSYAPIRESTALERDELLIDLADFLDVTRTDIDLSMLSAEVEFKQEWLDKMPAVRDDVRNFWKESRLNLLWHTTWHFGDRRKWDMELMTALNRRRSGMVDAGDNLKVLDFGGGIGQTAIMLARSGLDVTIADLDGKALDFARYRFKKHDLPVKVWKVDKEDAPPDKYDVILATDSLEYLTKEDFRKVMPVLMKSKQKGCYVVVTHNRRTPLSVLPFDRETVEAINALVNLEYEAKNVNTAEYWDKIWGEEKLDTWRTYPDTFNKIIKEIQIKSGPFREPIRVADIGCGVGVLLRRIVEEVPNVVGYGVDISKTAVGMMVLKEPRITGAIMDFSDEDLQVKEGADFDVVVMTEFIEHMTDEQLPKVLNKSKKMLKKDGMLIITTPNQCLPKTTCMEHEQAFSADEITELMQRHFSEVKTEFTTFGEWEYVMCTCRKAIN